MTLVVEVLAGPERKLFQSDRLTNGLSKKSQAAEKFVVREKPLFGQPARRRTRN